MTLRTARLTVITASGITKDANDQPVARIRAAVLHPRELGPQRRRNRITPRRVKRAISPFAYGKSRNDDPLHEITISIVVTGPPVP